MINGISVYHEFPLVASSPETLDERLGPCAFWVGSSSHGYYPPGGK